ncbi:hypothetical protein JCM8202_005903 [Rhodotorula sphaerocarpa]
MSKLIGYLPPPLPLLIDVLNLRNPVNGVLFALATILTLRILLPPPPYVPAPYGLPTDPSEAYNWRPQKHPHTQLSRTWTPQELQKYDGRDPNHEDGRILFAIRRKVYDVTAGRSFYGPGGPYEAFAGRDASRGLAKQSFEADMLTPVDQPIDDLADLTPSEWENLRDWEGHFATKYILCGDLVQGE